MERQDIKKLIKDTLQALGQLKQDNEEKNTKWIFALSDAQKMTATDAPVTSLAEYILTLDKSGDMFQFIVEYNKANELPPFETQAYFAVRKLNKAVFKLVAV